MNKKGFTIVEILAVIVIIGILISLAVVGITRYREKSNKIYYDALSSQIALATKTYYSNNPDQKPRGQVVDEGNKKIIGVILEANRLLENNYLINNIVDVNDKECNSESFVVAKLNEDGSYSYNVCLKCDGKEIIWDNDKCKVENYETDEKKYIKEDAIPPTCNITYDKNSDELVINSSDTDLGSTPYSLDNKTTWISDKKISITNDNGYYQTYIKDKYGNVGFCDTNLTSHTLTINIGNGIDRQSSNLSHNEIKCRNTNNNSCEVTVPNDNIIVPLAKYEFKGYKDINNTKYLEGQTVTLISDKIITAYAEKKVTITYLKGSNVSSIGKTTDSCYITDGQTTCSITTPSISPSSNYTTIGWNTSSSSSTALYSTNKTIQVSDDMTLYALVKKKSSGGGSSCRYICDPTDDKPCIKEC